ncbi:LytR C-terminal domain-containing protein [Streptacidiphilus sp. EB129]|uniref:LytR C-terminal domain-containing protein n=1 Tax=Streptacidiphilus sp. EB129 TaxID=3156262 RepID=UPI0035135E22
MPIEEDFTEALRATLLRYEPDTRSIVQAGVRNGRLRRRRRAAALLAGGTAALALVGLGAAVVPGQLSGRHPVDHSLATPPALPLSSGSGAAPGTAASTAAPTVAPAAIAVTVTNGTAISGRANQILSALLAAGFSHRSVAASSFPAAVSTLTYGPGEAVEAHTVAVALGLPADHLKQGTAAGLKLVIGADWTKGTTFPGPH